MLKLRPYQEELVEQVWSNFFTKNKQLVVAPTGSGKTECFIAICERAVKSKPDIKILILLNKVMLVEQTAERMSKLIGNVGIFCGSLNEREINNVTVASIQSIKDVDLDKINLVILDEVHNVSSKEDSNYATFLKKIEHDKLKIIGFTATPYRTSVPIYGKDQLFESIDYEIKIEYLIAEKYLVEPKVKASPVEFETKSLKTVAGDFDNKQISELTENEDRAIIQVNDALPRLEGRKKIVWACATIKHCEIIGSLINNSVVIHSQVKKDVQIDRLKRFKHGDTRHLVFVSMLSEGIDIPIIDALVFLRPTKSIVRYIQTVGRAIRPSEGKTDALILDYGQVVKNCGPLNKPFTRRSGERTNNEGKMKVCKECFSILESKVAVCPECGYEFVKKPKPLDLPRLTYIPETNVNILGSSINEMECGLVKISKHKSINGNNCIKITYYSPDIIPESVSEYFMWDNDWARKNLSRRLVDLWTDFYDDIDKQASVLPKKTPKKLIYTFDGKYKKVTRLIF